MPLHPWPFATECRKFKHGKGHPISTSNRLSASAAFLILLQLLALFGCQESRPAETAAIPSDDAMPMPLVLARDEVALTVRAFGDVFT
jgi:hypothetical protein